MKKIINIEIEEEFDLDLDQILEAVSHFQKRFRKGFEGDCDERYFYDQKDVIEFYSRYPLNNVGVRPYYEDGEFFCFELYRIA